MTCGSNSNMWSLCGGYSELREYQRKTIEAYVSGRDVFVSAPTGAGKSLTFEFAPYTFDCLLQCHRVGDCLKPKFPWHWSTVHRRRLLGRRARGYFKSEEKIVLGSPEAILNNYQHILCHLKRNHLKSLLETTFTQSKQICSFDDGDTHTLSIDLVRVESTHSAIEVKDSQMKPETPNASHATPHFWREMQIETLQTRQVDHSPLRRLQSATWRPKSKSRFVQSLEFLKKSCC